MRIEPHDLVVFALVAQSGSLTHAATTLHKSQPAVSARLKQLQEAVGEPLYTRHRYGVQLTPTGKLLLPYAQSVQRALSGARALVKERQAGLHGRLTITASMTIANYLLPKLLTAFHDVYPQLDLHLLTRNSHDALELLRVGKAEIAFVERPVDTDMFIQKPIAEDEIVLIVQPDHPLAKQTVLEPDMLMGLELIRRERGSGTRAVVDRALEHLGVTTKTTLVASSVATVKEAVLHGFGAAFISRLAVVRECDMALLCALPVNALGFKRPLTMLHPELSLCSTLGRHLISFFDEL